MIEAERSWVSKMEVDPEPGTAKDKVRWKVHPWLLAVSRTKVGVLAHAQPSRGFCKPQNLY